MWVYKSDLGWSSAILDYICSKEEAEIYIKAGLKEAIIGGKPALIRQDIDWSDYSIKRNTWLKDRLSNYDEWAKYNNADLIGEGFPPRDPNGDPYELLISLLAHPALELKTRVQCMDR